MIHEWKPNEGTRNFGDAVYELFLHPAVLEEWEADNKRLHFPVGSVIANNHIQHALNANLIPVFHNCGYRGEELDPKLLAQAEFDGVRGPHTRDALLEHGIDQPVTKDPVYHVAEKYSPGPPNGLAICVRHITDRTERGVNTIHELGVDAMFSPAVEDEADMIEFIQKISGSRFVLAGSLHAAILAHAYGVPFALFGGSRVDCPPKWEDWLASIDVTDVEWVDNIRDGRDWYNSAVAAKK